MARTFTTLFVYNGKTYTAVISNFDGIVNIYIPDESLHQILPRGKASYSLAEYLKPGEQHLTAAQRLIHCVLASTEEFADAGLKNIKMQE